MFRACRTKAMGTLGLLLLLPAALHAQVAPQPPQPTQQEFAREVAAGGLVFVQDPAIVIETEEMLIARNEISITYVLRNITAAERRILVAFPLPELDTAAIGDQPVKLPAQAANFVAAAFSVNGAPLTAEMDQRALALGLDVTAQLAALQITMQPYDPAVPGQLKRLPKVTKVDLLQRGILRAEDERIEPNWSARTTAFWRQSFPSRRSVTITLNYRPLTATAPFNPALLEAVRPTHCLDGAADVAVTRKVAAQGGKVAFNWTSFVPGNGSSLLGPARHFRLRIEKPSIDTLVVTCRGNLRPLGPTTLEWTAKNYLEEEIRILFVD